MVAVNRNSFVFSFHSLAACFGPYGPSSGECCRFLWGWLCLFDRSVAWAVFTHLSLIIKRILCFGKFVSSLVKNKRTPWSESASELYRPSDRRLSAKYLPTFADKGCHVVSVTDPYGRILGFLDRSRYFSIKYLLSCTHEAEWTPFVVVPGIEPGPPDL
jgi:hypothetical protein